MSGIELTVDLNQSAGNRVVAMARSDDGTKILPADIFTVVGCICPFDEKGVMCSNPGFESIEELSSPRDSSWTPMELLR